MAEVAAAAPPLGERPTVTDSGPPQQPPASASWAAVAWYPEQGLLAHNLNVLVHGFAKFLRQSSDWVGPGPTTNAARMEAAAAAQALLCLGALLPSQPLVDCAPMAAGVHRISGERFGEHDDPPRCWVSAAELCTMCCGPDIAFLYHAQEDLQYVAALLPCSAAPLARRLLAFPPGGEAASSAAAATAFQAFSAACRYAHHVATAELPAGSAIGRRELLGGHGCGFCSASGGFRIYPTHHLLHAAAIQDAALRSALALHQDLLGQGPDGELTAQLHRWAVAAGVHARLQLASLPLLTAAFAAIYALASEHGVAAFTLAPCEDVVSQALERCRLLSQLLSMDPTAGLARQQLAAPGRGGAAAALASFVSQVFMSTAQSMALCLAGLRLLQQAAALAPAAAAVWAQHDTLPDVLTRKLARHLH
ncbi:hypothetical protein ABPG75_006226 [Micractinium tetrahymenae]